MGYPVLVGRAARGRVRDPCPPDPRGNVGRRLRQMHPRSVAPHWGTRAAIPTHKVPDP